MSNFDLSNAYNDAINHGSLQGLTPDRAPAINSVMNDFAKSMNEFREKMEDVTKEISSMSLRMNNIEAKSFNFSFVDNPTDPNCVIKPFVLNDNNPILKRQIRIQEKTRHRVVILDVYPDKDGGNGQIVEYQHIDTMLEPIYKIGEGRLRELWTTSYWPECADQSGTTISAPQDGDTTVLMFDGTRWREMSTHQKQDGRGMVDDITKGQVWATTLGVFEVAAVFSGEKVDNQIYLKCLSTIHPYYKVGEIYWERPQYVRDKYRLLP